MPDLDAALDDHVGDDLLRLMFICLPPGALHRGAGGAHAPAARRPHDRRDRAGLPRPRGDRRAADRAGQADAGRRAGPLRGAPRRRSSPPGSSSVLGVLYLIFNEGYSATAGDDWMRPSLCEEALRLGRILAGLAPDEPEVHGLVALMEIQASRSAARSGPSGEPVLLLDQDRGRWDQLLIRRGLAALDRAEALGGAPRPVRAAGGDRRLPRAGPDGRGDRLARASRRSTASWPELAPSPVVELNRAVAVGDGVRAGGRARARRRADVGALAQGVSPAAERARRPARQARPRRRGARGVRARGLAHARTRASARCCSIAPRRPPPRPAPRPTVTVALVARRLLPAPTSHRRGPVLLS